MSVSKWAYRPELCDGKVCRGDCDYCSRAFYTVYDVLLERFQEEERKAFAKDRGLEEHMVWNKAIQIVEEYIE